MIHWKAARKAAHWPCGKRTRSNESVSSPLTPAPQRVGSARDVEFNLTDCTFLRNEMIVDNENEGGGALWVKGNKAPEGPAQDGVIHGTWSGCTFIENEGFKDGAIYMTSTALVEIEDCKFISNHSSRGGGAICVSDMEDLTTTELRICNSDFIGNTADTKGGAVYNRGGSTTTMVNCIVAGNVADYLGGGTCNADDFADPAAPTVFSLHNCLLAGNLADTAGNDGGGHLNRDGGDSTLINCTVVLNGAYDDSGGIENLDADSTLLVRNCIVWGNSDDNPDGADDQLHYTAGFNPGDVDKNVIEDCDDCFAGTVDNKDTDPDVVNTTTGMTWVSSSYNAATGITTFNMTVSVSSFNNERLFQPDGNSPLQLLIALVDEGVDTISCYGKWVDVNEGNSKTGTIYDYHIASGSSAIDYGDAAYIDDLTSGGSGDVCDLDGDGETDEKLPYDLDPTNGRNQGTGPGPDAGAYEVPD